MAPNARLLGESAPASLHFVEGRPASVSFCVGSGRGSRAMRRAWFLASDEFARALGGARVKGIEISGGVELQHEEMETVLEGGKALLERSRKVVRKRDTAATAFNGAQLHAQIVHRCTDRGFTVMLYVDLPDAPDRSSPNMLLLGT